VTNAAGQVLEEAFSTALDTNINRHAEKLNEGVREHAERLAQDTRTTMDQLQQGLDRWAEMLVEGVEKHGRALTEAERELAQENRRHLSEVEAAWGEAIAVAADRQDQLAQQGESLLHEIQVTSSEMTRAAFGQQEQLIKQGEILLRVVEATGQIKKLEDGLNQNLAALVQTCNFDEGMLNLSAAIQLLSARLGHPTSRPSNLGAVRDPSRHYAA
jgi:chromosome segregation ATPase